MRRSLTFAMAVIGVMFLATSGLAQTTGGDTFDGLSPGNKMIAESLFEAQTTNSAGDSTWTLEQISSAKADGQGWGQVFQQMQADGVIGARNLGQVVSQHVRASAPPPPPAPSAPEGVVITDGGNGTSAASEPGPSAAAERGRSNRGNAAGQTGGRPSFSSSGASSPAGGPPAGRGGPVASGANGAGGGFTPPGQAGGASASGGNGLGRGGGR